jgi:hypothetical protein
MSLDKHQLARLHAVLSPFMLRRVKADVVAEMVPKTEVCLEPLCPALLLVAAWCRFLLPCFAVHHCRHGSRSACAASAACTAVLFVAAGMKHVVLVLRQLYLQSHSKAASSRDWPPVGLLPGCCLHVLEFGCW